MRPFVTYAIIEEREGHGKWNLMGVWTPSTGHLACVNSRLDFIQMLWAQFTPAQKQKAKIVKLMEIEDVKTADHETTV